ncbi:MAG: hypothetical protein ACJAQ6_001982 [Arenicella sp.]|jgi:hypothetical protein
MVQTIVYTSRATLPDGATPGAKPVWLDSLVERAAAKNMNHNISGVLSYKAGRIIQLIEGESAQIQSLYAKISNDNRHQNVLILLNIKDSQRAFLDWGMVLEASIDSSSLFRDFLHAHFEQLVEMTEHQSDELIFFIDHIFSEIAQIKNDNYRH